MDQNIEEAGFQPGEKKPKYRRLAEMLSFRVVPAYLKEIEKVAKQKGMSTSKLIRTYIKEGMKRDHEISGLEDKEFRIE